MSGKIRQLLIVFGMVVSFQVSGQRIPDSVSTKSESETDTVRRFKLEDGSYVGVNPNIPIGSSLKKTVSPSVKSTEKHSFLQEKRLGIEDGKDVGVGSEFRSERLQSLRIRQQIQKDRRRQESINDSIPKKRIVLQDGKYVGAGLEKSVKPR